jgi:hypothetical protein
VLPIPQGAIWIDLIAPIAMMVCAAIGPYLFFRWKKWL